MAIIQFGVQEWLAVTMVLVRHRISVTLVECNEIVHVHLQSSNDRLSHGELMLQKRVKDALIQKLLPLVEGEQIRHFILVLKSWVGLAHSRG